MQTSEPVIDQQLYELEVLDGEVVAQPLPLPEPVTAERAPVWVSASAMQTAAAAATGFVAGAAALALLRHYGMARLERGAAAHAGDLLPSSRGGRTYIVHVRPLRPDSE